MFELNRFRVTDSSPVVHRSCLHSWHKLVRYSIISEMIYLLVLFLILVQMGRSGKSRCGGSWILSQRRRAKTKVRRVLSERQFTGSWLSLWYPPLGQVHSRVIKAQFLFTGIWQFIFSWREGTPCKGTGAEKHPLCYTKQSIIRRKREWSSKKQEVESLRLSEMSSNWLKWYKWISSSN